MYQCGVHFAERFVLCGEQELFVFRGGVFCCVGWVTDGLSAAHRVFELGVVILGCAGCVSSWLSAGSHLCDDKGCEIRTFLLFRFFVCQFFESVPVVDGCGWS